MADTTFIPTPQVDGLFGAGGGGLIGGLILGSLLRNNGNLFGADGTAASGVATAATVQNTVANSAIQQSLGDIKASIPLAEAQVQTAISQSQLATTGAFDSKFSDLTAFVNSLQNNLTTQNNSLGTLTQAGFSALNNNLNNIENNLSGHLNDINSQVAMVSKDLAIQTGVLSAAISNDGDKTRALLTQQYEATLNRQLGDANARIVALENARNLDSVQRGVEISTTNNINQAQAQTQQQQQFNALASLVANLANDIQYVRATNQAINVGGFQTANPLNTNTNIRS